MESEQNACVKRAVLSREAAAPRGHAARWHPQSTPSYRNIGCGRKRAAFLRKLVLPTLVRARAAEANKRRLRLLEEWKREELQRTPFAILDERPPGELRPTKGRK